MTDRYNGFTVALDHDIREDDAQATLAAIRQIKGVVAVRPVLADVIQDQVIGVRIKNEVIEKLITLIREVQGWM